jgi:polyphosphate glucokinase
MNVLIVDVGGTHVKVLASGQKESRKFDFGPALVPGSMVLGVQKIATDWSYDVVSIGYPGPVLHNRPVADPHNLGRGCLGFNLETAFGHSAKLINDAAMQALGSYKGGKMLFLWLGTGLGSTMIVDGIVEPMELGHLPDKSHTYEAYVGQRGLDR